MMRTRACMRVVERPTAKYPVPALVLKGSSENDDVYRSFGLTLFMN